MYGVILGEHDVNRMSGHEVYMDLSKIITHHKFNQRSFENDIALVKVNRTSIMPLQGI